jgi:sec-independent protein translocase protein TatC
MEQKAPGDREMTMLEHLDELRQRLVVSVMAVIVGIVASVIPIPGFDSITHFSVKLISEEATSSGVVLQMTRPGEGFFTFLQVSLIIGMALAMPVIVYQVLAFVTPALYENEKRYLYIAVPGVTLSFLAGVVFCYKLMLPFAIAFLGSFATDIFKAQWTAENYLDFVTTFMFWVGVTFELPIVMYFLSKVGIVSAQRMARFRRYAFVLAFVIGAIITPTPDPVNQTIVSLPIYFLFELGIILARFA